MCKILFPLPFYWINYWQTTWTMGAHCTGGVLESGQNPWRYTILIFITFLLHFYCQVLFSKFDWPGVLSHINLWPIGIHKLTGNNVMKFKKLYKWNNCTDSIETVVCLLLCSYQSQFKLISHYKPVLPFHFGYLNKRKFVMVKFQCVGSAVGYWWTSRIWLEYCFYRF